MDWLETGAKLLPWLIELPVFPKILISLILVLATMFLLGLVWLPAKTASVVVTPDGVRRSGNGSAVEIRATLSNASKNPIVVTGVSVEVIDSLLWHRTSATERTRTEVVNLSLENSKRISVVFSRDRIIHLEGGASHGVTIPIQLPSNKGGSFSWVFGVQAVMNAKKIEVRSDYVFSAKLHVDSGVGQIEMIPAKDVLAIAGRYIDSESPTLDSLVQIPDGEFRTTVPRELIWSCKLFPNDKRFDIVRKAASVRQERTPGDGFF